MDPQQEEAPRQVFSPNQDTAADKETEMAVTNEKDGEGTLAKPPGRALKELCESTRARPDEVLPERANDPVDPVRQSVSAAISTKASLAIQERYLTCSAKKVETKESRTTMPTKISDEDGKKCKISDVEVMLNNMDLPTENVVATNPPRLHPSSSLPKTFKMPQHHSTNRTNVHGYQNIVAVRPSRNNPHRHALWNEMVRKLKDRDAGPYPPHSRNGDGQQNQQQRQRQRQQQEDEEVVAADLASSCVADWTQTMVRELHNSCQDPPVVPPLEARDIPVNLLSTRSSSSSSSSSSLSYPSTLSSLLDEDCDCGRGVDDDYHDTMDDSQHNNNDNNSSTMPDAMTAGPPPAVTVLDPSYSASRTSSYVTESTVADEEKKSLPWDEPVRERVTPPSRRQRRRRRRQAAERDTEEGCAADVSAASSTAFEESSDIPQMEQDFTNHMLSLEDTTAWQLASLAALDCSVFVCGE